MRGNVSIINFTRRRVILRPSSHPRNPFGVRGKPRGSAVSSEMKVSEAPKEENLEVLARKVVALENEAVAAHELAQQLNKEGRFQEAKQAYATMHQLEDEASELAKKVGCVQCVLGSGDSSNESNNFCALDPLVLEQYAATYQTSSWAQVISHQAIKDLLGGPNANPVDTLRKRASGAVVGSAIADCAATGVHWVYDLKVLNDVELQYKAKGKHGLEFMDPPLSPFYNYPVGHNSPYGEQTAVLLSSLAQCGGLDCRHYADTFAKYFGADFHGYRDVSTKGFLRNYSRGITPPFTGADDAQANCTARLAPLLAMFAGHDNMLRMVEMATRVTQNSDAACAWATVGAVILERLLMGDRPSEAVSSVASELETGTGRAQGLWDMAAEVAVQLRRTVDLASVTPSEALQLLGRNCHMPNALTTPLQVVLHVEYLRSHKSESSSPGALTDFDAGSTTGSQWFQHGVRLAIREGGCCASRAAYVGACLGAMWGTEAIPLSWQKRYLLREQLTKNVEDLVACRDEPSRSRL